MYRHILARDLRRKKTMNLIMLLFIIIAAAFIASSLSIIIPVTTGLDGYFDKANLSDYFIITIHDDENAAKITKLLDESEVVDSYYIDNGIYISSNDIYVDGVSASGNIKCVENIDAVHQKYFDSNNNLVESIPDDTLMTCNSLLDDLGVKPGDTLEINLDGEKVTLKIAEPLKDALTGSTFMGFDRIYVNTATYEKICTAADNAENATYSLSDIYAISTNDAAAFAKALSTGEVSTVFADTRAIIKFCYVFDMIIAGILLVVSIVLILIAMVVLRFTILFTLEEEFREIGIMKAVGIGNRKIRGLYLIKYLAISVIGAVVGVICSVPFSGLFMAPIEKNVVFDLGMAQPFICIFSALAVIAIIMLFCYSCTRRINKFSPIDAIRNGSSGERFTRKSLLRLSKTHIATVPFMALNDILSSVKRYIVMIIVFTLCTLMMIIPLNSVNTLKSTGVIELLGMCGDCDLHINNTTVGMAMMTQGRAYIDSTLDDIKTTLEENGMPAQLSTAIAFTTNVTLGDSSAKINALQETSFKTDEFPYIDGTAPKNPNEIAMTGIAADTIGAKIGDSLNISISGVDYGEFVLTGLFQSMNNLGKEIRFNTDYDKLPYENAAGCTSIQIRFTDNPDEQTVIEREKKVKELFADYEVRTMEESVESMLGSTIEPLSSVGMLTILVVIIIDMLVAVLMMKSFIIKEKGEIATLKSIGFGNGALVLWQSLRIGFVMIFSTLLAILISEPITRISAGQLFKMMGADHISFVINPLEVYIFYPLVILSATMLVSVITAAGLRKISPQDAGSID